MQGNLKIFFYPRVIAVIGASNTPEKVGNVIIKKLENFPGKIIPVNNKEKIIEGKISYKNVKEYPGQIDLAIIATPARKCTRILKICGKKKIPNVILISSGFSEAGNFRLEKKLLEISKKYKITLLGPNCFGTTNPYSQLDCTFSNTISKKGNTAVISQSGALWSYISDLNLEGGFSGFVSLGNMAQLDFSDFIEYFNCDKKTKKIILYMERVKNGKKFIEVCRKSKKEIFVVKAGQTKEGKRAVISHTGSLATDYKVYKGAFKQAGIRMFDSLAEALGIKKQKIKIKSGKKVLIVTNAGGSGALVTDYCKKNNLELIDKVPMDLLGTADAEKYKLAFGDILKRREEFDVLIVILTPQRMTQPLETAREIIKFRKKIKKEIVAVFLGEKSIKKAKLLLKKNKIVCLTHCC